MGKLNIDIVATPIINKDDVVSIIGRFEKRGNQLFFTPLQEKFNA